LIQWLAPRCSNLHNLAQLTLYKCQNRRTENPVSQLVRNSVSSSAECADNLAGYIVHWLCVPLTGPQRIRSLSFQQRHSDRAGAQQKKATSHNKDTPGFHCIEHGERAVSQDLTSRWSTVYAAAFAGPSSCLKQHLDLYFLKQNDWDAAIPTDTFARAENGSSVHRHCCLLIL
jgi:hypothetical protein